MAKNRFAVLIVLGAVIFTFAATGCTEKNSASEEINKSNILIISGVDRIDNTNFEDGNYSDIRIKLAASKVDYEEALKILEAADTDYEEEKQIIESNKIICSYSLDAISISEKMIFFMEHTDKANAYLQRGDIESYRSEISQSQDVLNTIPPLVSSAKAKISSIDLDIVPPETRAIIIEDQMAIEEIEKMFSEIQVLTEGNKYPG